MKDPHQFKQLLFLLFCLLAVSLSASGATEEISREVGITFTFNNSQLIEEDGDNYLEFQVEAAATEAGTRLGTGVLLINYDETGFGQFVAGNGNVEVTKGELLTAEYPVYELIVNDNQANRLAVTFYYSPGPGFGNLLPVEATELVLIRMLIQDQNSHAGLSFAAGLMQGQQYQDDNATLYDPVIANDTDNIYLGAALPPPDNLNISINADQVNLSWDPLTGYTYNVYSASEPHIASQQWFLEAGNITVNQITLDLTAAKRFYFVTAEIMERAIEED